MHEARIPLKALNPPGLGHALAAGGVPFSAGELPGNTHFAIRTIDGVELPSRQETLSSYPDGSIRWLLVECALAAEAPVDLFLHRVTDNGTRSQPVSHSVQFDLNGETPTVSNGLVRFQIEPDQFRPLGKLERFDAARNEWGYVLDQMELEIADGYPKQHRAGAETSAVEIELNTALHGIVRYRGSFMRSWSDDAPRIAYDLRIHIFAGQPDLRLELFLANVCNEDWLALREIDLDFRTSEPLREVRFGDGAVRSLTGNASWRLLQSGPDHIHPWLPFEYRILNHRHETRATGERAPGWLTASGEQNQLVLALNEVWEKHPKGFAADEGRLRAALWPRDAAPLALPRGVGICHELMLRAFAPGEDAAAHSAEMEQRLRHPPRLICTPERYCTTGVFGALAPASGDLADYNSAVERAYTSIRGERIRRRLYGMLDFGDFPFAPAEHSHEYNRAAPVHRENDEWSNLEYDLPHGWFLHFARTGDARYLEEALIEIRHRMDVDIVHHDPDPDLCGANFKHHTGHAGRRDGATGSAKFLLDHTWLQGFWDAHFLTGDAHARDTALLATESLMRNTAAPIERKRERNYGWALIALMESYRATGDSRILARAERIVDDAIRQQNPDGSFLSNNCGGIVINGNKPFMMGILMEAMHSVYQVRPSEKIETFIRGAASWLERMWIEADCGFAYSVCEMAGGRPGDNRELVGLYFAHQITGEAKYLDMARRNFRAGFALRMAEVDSCKDAAIFLRATPHFMALCREAGIEL